MRKGNEHEAAYLARIEGDGRTVARMLTYDDEGFVDDDARRATEDAIRAGAADVIYQAYLTDGTWRGFADFLERLPDGTYEPVDTKLARSAKPLHVIQLCFYAEQLERVQGRLPEHVHVELGSGERVTLRTADFIAFFRRSRERLLAAIDGDASRGGEPETMALARLPLHDLRLPPPLPGAAGRGGSPDPRRRARAAARGAARRQGITTLTQLGETAPDTHIPRIRPETFESIRSQAALQLHFTRTGERLLELLPDEEDRGFRLLPPPSAGDVWLDLEGHPFYEPARGLEYLFGWCYRDDESQIRYEAVWGTDRDGEKVAFERFVDWLQERRRRFPDLHVYHYAAYEQTALKRLMGEHSVREDEIDDWLRQEVLVDLYRVVKQALRAGVTSYSIKEIEKLYGFERTAEVEGGAESVVLFEQWIEAQDPALLAAIGAYNEEDCRSTVALHEWLLGLRPPELPWRLPPDQREQTPEAEERDAARVRLHEELLAGAAEGDTRFLLAHLLYYHRREAKSQWWEWFHHLSLDEDELIEDTDTIGGLELVGEPVEDGQSLVYTLKFPAQEHKIGGRSIDPATEQGYRVEVDDEHGTITLKRGANRAEEPLPKALIPGPPIPDWRAPRVGRAVRAARICERADRGPGKPGPLRRSSSGGRRGRGSTSPCPRPRSRSTAATSSSRARPARARRGRARRRRSRSCARAGASASRRSATRRSTSSSPRSSARRASRASRSSGARSRPRGTRTRGSRATSSTRATRGASCSTRSSSSSPARRGSSSYPEFEGFLDTLIVDEAGQVALADVIAVGHAARNLVLLGDPNQLPQVSQGAQPDEAKASVLQHLLGDETTVPPDRGIFLAETWRLRPELTAFTSDAYYAGRLEHAEITARRSVAAGNGLVFRPVEHAANGQLSWEEADEVAKAIAGAARHRLHGRARPHAPAHRRRRPRGHAVQRPGARASPAGAGRRPRGHGRQVPGAGGAGRDRLARELERGGGAARPRLRLQREPDQRRDLARAVPRRARLLAAAARGRLPHGRGDAARERALPLRRAR